MNDKKNIDRLFQEKFKDFEVAPNDALWDRINESLPHKKKKRRVIALWWQIGGVAAAITLLFTVGVTVFNTDYNIQEFPIVNSEDKNTPLEKDPTNTATDNSQHKFNKVKEESTTIANTNIGTEQNSKVNDSEELPQQNTKASHRLTTPKYSNTTSNAVANTTNNKVKNKTDKRVKNTTVSNEPEAVRIVNQTKTSTSHIKEDNSTELASEIEKQSVLKKNLKDSKTIVAERTKTTTAASEYNDETSEINDRELQELISENLEEETIEDAIAENNETISEEEKEDDRSRWSIAPNVAPVYFNAFGEGSSLDKQFNENSKNSDVNMSYGIAGSYAISKKIKIRAGINRVNLNQTTSDVFAFVGPETAARSNDASFNNIAFSTSNETQQVSLMSAKMMNRSSTPELFNTKIAGQIDQRFGFIEIPLEIEYRLLDTKFGINIISGFSTLFLSENEIYADVNGRSELIGEANNINDTSFSANFGLGMDYRISRQWNINLEPTFKYQINTFNNTTGDFKPFFIGLYTGLSYKF